MADSVDKVFPFTTSTNPSLSDNSGESNENEVNYDELSSKLHQPKKPLTKHFMSPTISATTKAAATLTRKKILTDRNESSNFFDTRLEKSPNILDSSVSSHTKSPSRFIRPSSSRLAPSQSLDDEDQNVFAFDSSLKPYDPVTSYTSPRPKFLRYNPNRLHHLQNQIGKEDLMCFDSQMDADALNSVVSSSQESPKKDEESEFDENGKGDQDMDREEDIEENDEEEIEEIYNERGLSLKDMLKFLLVVVALFFSTIYISSMNSPNPSPTIEALQDLRDGYYGIQQKVFEVVNMKKIFEGITGTLSPKVERNADAEYEGIRVEDENRGLRGGNEEFGEVVEVENVQKPDISDEPERNWETLNQFVQVTENTKREDVIVVGPELENKVEREIETAEGFQTFQDHQVLGEEVVEGVFIDEEIKKSDEVLEFETAERFKSFQDCQAIEEVVDVEIAKVDEIESNSLDESVILHGENEEEYETVSVESFQDRQVLGEVVNVEKAKVEETGSNSLDESVILNGENKEDYETVSVESFQDRQVLGEVVDVEKAKVEETGSNSLDESVILNGENKEDHETVSVIESDLKEAIINKLAMIESIPKYKIGVPMLIFTILASLGLVYRVKHKKTSLTQEPSAESCETQYQKALQQEKIKKIEFKAKPLAFEQEKIKKTEFEAKPSALVRSIEEEKGASKEFSSISQAPIVELLSELMIGEVSSSSLKSSGVKSKLSEIEESNNSVSQEKTRSHITPSSSLVEFSAVDSPSYGSFTSLKKISKKEEAKDGEANMLITPVRRSSRIRNRAVMSP